MRRSIWSSFAPVVAAAILGVGCDAPDAPPWSSDDPTTVPAAFHGPQPVFVTNGDPLPTRAVGTTTVAGAVSQQGAWTVAIGNTPTVALAPGGSVAVSSLPAVSITGLPPVSIAGTPTVAVARTLTDAVIPEQIIAITADEYVHFADVSEYEEVRLNVRIPTLHSGVTINVFSGTMNIDSVVMDGESFTRTYRIPGHLLGVNMFLPPGADPITNARISAFGR